MSERGADPHGTHRFRVTCDVLPEGLGFTEVRGLSVRVAEPDAAGPAAGRAGRKGRIEGRRRRPGRSDEGYPAERRETTSPTLALSRGVSDDRSLWNWLQSWAAGEVEPRDVRVCLLDARGEPVRGWVCRAARPVRWRGPDLVAERAAVATETLTLSHEGIDDVADLAECEP